MRRYGPLGVLAMAQAAAFAIPRIADHGEGTAVRVGGTTETREPSDGADTATQDANRPEPPLVSRQQRRARERAERKAGLRMLKIGRRTLRAVNK